MQRINGMVGKGSDEDYPDILSKEEWLECQWTMQ
jgi:hypothetical protein